MFAIAGEFKTMVWGSTTSGLRRAMIRLLASIRARRFNSDEATGISKGHFLGIPYTRASAQQDTDWAHS